MGRGPISHEAIPGQAIAPVYIESILHLMRLLKPRRVALCIDGWLEVNNKGGDVKGEDEGNDPFEDGGDVVVVGEGGRDEDNGQDELDQDEGELDPKGGTEDAILPVFYELVSTGDENVYIHTYIHIYQRGEEREKTH